MPLELVRHIFGQIVKGIEYLHQINHLVHLDLKPDNIIIRDDYSIAIIDFGLS